MKRQTLLSAAHQSLANTHDYCSLLRGIIPLLHPVHLITCMFICTLSLLPHQMFSLVSTHSSSSLHGCTAANDFLYLTVSNWHANFPASELWSILPPSCLLFGFLFALCRFGSDTPHLQKKETRGVGRGVCLDHMTAVPDFPPIKRHRSLQTAPCNFHHSSATKPHKGGGAHVRCLSPSDVETEHRQHRMYLLWNDWDMLFPRPRFASFNLHFLTFSLAAAPPLCPTARCRLSSLLSSCSSDLSAAAITLTAKTLEALNQPSSNPPHHHDVWFGLISAFSETVDETDKMF